MEILRHRLMKGRVQRTEFNKSFGGGESQLKLLLPPPEFHKNYCTCWKVLWAGSLGLEFLESHSGLAYL